jgi:NADPH:quinone reductase-like Zn-dependent oxidoreductase
MRAAVVTAFDQPPTCQDVPNPAPKSAHEILVDVLAAGLHPRVRSQADGSHYTSTGELPLVPGIDGVGRAADGTLRYFVLPDTTMGSMAEQTVVDPRRSVALPEDADPLVIAAAMNPAMSSWIALRRRVQMQPGQKVMVIGATGSAGRMAIQVAKRLGAGQVVAAGRSPERLAALGADATVVLGEAADHPRQEDICDIDVVLDYVWGGPAVEAMRALAINRADPARSLTWIQIGSVAGADAAIPSAALRATGLQIIGSGQGSVSTRDIVAELPVLASEICRGTFRVDVASVPLSEIGRAWETVDSDKRIVITP